MFIVGSKWIDFVSWSSQPVRLLICELKPLMFKVITEKCMIAVLYHVACVLSGILSFSKDGFGSFFHALLLCSFLSSTWNHVSGICLRFGLLDTNFLAVHALSFSFLSPAITVDSFAGCVWFWTSYHHHLGLGMHHSFGSHSLHWKSAVILMGFLLRVTCVSFSCGFRYTFFVVQT